MAGEGLPVQLATRVLAVTDSGYYAWGSRAPSVRAIRHVWLTDQILQVHAASHGTYGARRVHAELTLGRGLVLGHGTVELLMARAGIRGVTGRPRWRRPTPDLISTDLVERNFARSEPNQLWVIDITEHPTREGKVYCAVVLDTYSRRVVGWSVDAAPTAALVTNALGMAIDSRTPPSGAVIHSDRGVQIRSTAFVRTVKNNGLVGSMDRVDACGDNAAMKSFFALLQRTCSTGSLGHPRGAPSGDITWIERTYHRRRRQRRLDRVTAVEYETLTSAAAAA